MGLGVGDAGSAVGGGVCVGLPRGVAPGDMGDG